jgi:hypothetical protein
MNRWRTFRQVNIYLGAVAFAAGVSYSARSRASAPQCSQVLLLRRDASQNIEKQIEELARLRYEIDMNLVAGSANSIVTNVISKNYPVLLQKLISETGIPEAEVKLRIGQKIIQLQRDKHAERDKQSERTHQEEQKQSIAIELERSMPLPFALVGSFDYKPKQQKIYGRALMISKVLGDKIGAATLMFDAVTREHKVIQENSVLYSLVNDGKTLLTLDKSGELLFVETQGGKVVQSIKTELFEMFKDENIRRKFQVESWAVSPSENLLALTLFRQLIVMDLNTGKLVAQSPSEFMNNPTHAKQMRFINDNELMVHDAALGLVRMTVDDSKVKILVPHDFAYVVFERNNQSVMLAPHMSTKHPGGIYHFGSGHQMPMDKYFSYAKPIPGTNFFFGKSTTGKYFDYGVYHYGEESAVIPLDRPDLIGEWSGKWADVEITSAGTGGDYLILHHRPKNDGTKSTLEFYKVK